MILEAGNPARARVARYLDDAICQWRRTRDEATHDATYRMAIDYIDAFQSVRVSLIGHELPAEAGDG